MMRFTALCMCGTLLVFSSHAWTTVDSDQGDLQRDNEHEPCTLTLRSDGLCQQGQDESTCPYLISLPPLTVHLPKQLRELEKIVKDLQRLKDNVDQLRKMCADCTVSQTESECGRQREHEMINEDMDKHEDEWIWLNERNPDKQKDFIQEYETDRFTAANAMDGFSDTDTEERAILDDNGRKEWESERYFHKELVKEHENDESLQEVTGTHGKTQADGSKGNDKFGQSTMPSAYGDERIGDTVVKVKQNNRERETVRNKEKDEKGNSEGDPENTLRNDQGRKITSNLQSMEKTEDSEDHTWRHEAKKTEKKTQTGNRGTDGIKMSEDHGENTNRERQQHGEEGKMETESGIKVGRTSEKPKQTESNERTEKQNTKKQVEAEVGVEEEGERERERDSGEEMKKDVEKPDQRVDGGEFIRATEVTDFVVIDPTTRSSKSLSPRHDSNEAITLESPLRSPLSSSKPFIKQGMAISDDGLSSAGISEHPSLGAEVDVTTTSRPATAATMSTVGGPGQRTISDTTRFTSTTRAGPEASLQMEVGHQTVATVTTTAPHQNLYITALPGAADHSRWTAKKNSSSNAVNGTNPLPMPDRKQKSATKPKANQKHKASKNEHKPDRVPLPNKKTKHGQKQKPSTQKLMTNQKSKPGQDLTQDQIPKPDLRPLPAEGNLKNTKIPKREHRNDERKLPIQKPKPHQKSTLPVQRPTPRRKPQIINVTGSDKERSTDQVPPSQKLMTNQKSKLGQDLTQVQIPKPDLRPPPAVGNLKDTQIPKQEQRNEPKPYPKSELPVQRPSSHQTPESVNATSSDKDPVTDQDPESIEITTINQNLKLDEELVRLLQPDEPNQKQKPHRKPTSDGNTKHTQRSTLNQYSTPIQEPKPEKIGTTSPTPKMNQEPVPESMEDSEENTSPDSESAQDSSPGQKLTPDHVLIKPDEQNHGHSDLETLQKTDAAVNPKPDQTPQMTQWLKTPQPEQMPLDPKSVSDDAREAESKETSRALPRQKPPARPTAEPRTTSTQRPKPGPKTKTDLDPPHITRIAPDDIPNSQTGTTTASGHRKQTNGVTHPLAETELSPNKMKTITLGPKTSYRMETGPLPHRHPPPDGLTMSPNSRITSDLRPQTATQPPSIPMTTRTNTLMLGILPNFISSIRPGSETPKQVSSSHARLQVKTLHNVEDTVPKQTPDPGKMVIPVPPLIAQTPSTTSADLRTKNSANSGLQSRAPEASTPSPRELRVKINQVAAFFNNSRSPNGKQPESHRTEHDRTPERDSKPPTPKPPKVTVALRDCSDHLLRGETKSGAYLLTPDLRSRSFTALCDMQLDGGGWTLLQRRQDGSVSFNRTWSEYRSGFGKLDGGEFWLGNNMIHLLTRDRDMMLRVELEDFDGVTGYAHYELFRVAGERLRYRLTVGGYSGTAGDALRFSKSYDHNNRSFTTPDRDHDRYPSGNCGAYYSSGWWFDACMSSNLNGRYYVGRYKGVRDGIFWGTWHNISTEYYPTNDRQSFKSIRMMIRPRGFTP